MNAKLAVFLEGLHSKELRVVDRAVAALWWYDVHGGDNVGVGANELAKELEAAGYGQQNPSRLRRQLEGDRRTAKNRDGTFRISARARQSLEAEFTDYLKERPARESDSVLPTDLFRGSRGYIEKVVHQINASFDAALYDCTAVMCRRLLETLIIETYETAGRAVELKGSDGHFMVFSGLLAHLESDSRINIGRESLKGLRAFKTLGDQSAHNRRFNARRDDVIRIRDGLRLASEELLHLANLTKPA